MALMTSYYSWLFLVIISASFPELTVSFSELYFPCSSTPNPQNWEINGSVFKTDTCGTDQILGPFSRNTVLSINYTNLDFHSEIQLNFNIYFIDGWTDASHFKIAADGTQIFEISPDSPQNLSCGSSAYLDQKMSLGFSFLHATPTLNLEIFSDLGPSSGLSSWGLCNFAISFTEISCTTSPLIYFEKNTCVASCSSSYTLQGSYCIPCDPACATCSGTENYQCVTCSSGYYSLGSTCYSNCPSGYYNDQTSATCLKCSTQCVTCDGPGSNSCTSCPIGLYLLGSECVSNTSCPDWTFVDDYTRSCSECPESCLTCAGKYDHECLTCPTNYSLQPVNDTEPAQGFCVLNCSDGFYQKSFNSCEPCESPCVSCAYSAKNCTDCVKGTYLMRLGESNRCVNSCSEAGRYWEDNYEYVCEDIAVTEHTKYGTSDDGMRSTVYSSGLYGWLTAIFGLTLYVIVFVTACAITKQLSNRRIRRRLQLFAEDRLLDDQLGNIAHDLNNIDEETVANADEALDPLITDQKLLCVICKAAKRTTVIYDCKHLSTCLKCSFLLLKSDEKLCPTCKQPISKIERVFY